MNTLKKGLAHHGPAIAIFILLAVLYSYPAFQGNILNQHDTISWKAMSWEAREHYEKTGETTLWSNAMFCGMPTYTFYVAGVTNAIASIQNFITKIFITPSDYLLIAMICFYILLVSLRKNRWISIIGAISYAFISYHLQALAAGHVTKVFSIAYMPLALAGVIHIYKGKYIHGGIALLFGLSFMLMNGMYQVDYYLVIMLGILGIFYFLKAVKEKKWKTFIIASAISLICGVISILPNIMPIALTREYTEATMRGGKSELTINKSEKDKNKKSGGLDKDYAFQWSQGIGETFTLLAPNLYGGGSSTDVGTGSNTYEVLSGLAGENAAEDFSKHVPLYWGPQPFVSGPNYMGILTIFFMVLGLIVIKPKMKWVFFAIGILGILLSWGKHFSSLNYFLFDHLPMYNKFRTPSMAMVIPGLMFTFLAFWGLHKFVVDERDFSKRWKDLKLAFIIVGGLTFLIGIGGSFFMDFRSENENEKKQQIIQMMGGNQQAGEQLYSAMVKDRSYVAMKDGIRSMAFILLAVAVLFFLSKGKIKREYALGAIGLLVILDLVLIDRRYLNAESFVDEQTYMANFAPRPVDLQIKQDTDPYYRVFDLSRNVYNDATQCAIHKCIGGYSPAKLESIQDLIDVQLTPGVKMNQEVLNMLNAKYIIYNGQGGQAQMQPNPNACGNAWFVSKIITTTNADEEMLALNAPNLGDTAPVNNPFQPKAEAIVRDAEVKGQKTQFIKSDSAFIKLTEYSLNHLNFESNNPQDGFGVFSDVYYNKGWKAYIDDKETPIIRTNYLLRGLYIPAGNHKIQFKFIPETFVKTKPIQIASSYVILFLILGGMGWLLYKEIKKEQVSTNE